MSIEQIVGAIILATPFAALFVVIAREDGVWEALALFFGVTALVALLGLGCYLLTGSLS